MVYITVGVCTLLVLQTRLVSQQSLEYYSPFGFTRVGRWHPAGNVNMMAWIGPCAVCRLPGTLPVGRLMSVVAIKVAIL